MSLTFGSEDKLPELPVPELSATINQLLVALKPLLASDEYSELLNESTQFMNHDLINLIQLHLKKALENPHQSCYLNSINDETNPGIYGDLRGDILPRNPYLILQEDPYSKFMNPPNQYQRAASLINSSLKFIISLRAESLKPDLTPKNLNPLTMNCYKNLFGTTRVPDVFDSNYQHISIKKSKTINDSNHIIIMANNQYYMLQVLTDMVDDGSNQQIIFNDFDLSLILKEIIDESDAIDDIESINNAIGSLTTHNFNYWKLSRLELMKSNTNNLEIIDSALFMVVLDNNSPQSDQDKTTCISHGTSHLSDDNIQTGSCTSRWYDKLQLIVTKNSVAGVVWESTSMDSTAILRFISDIYTDSILKLAKNINGIEYSLFGNGEIQFVSNKMEKPTYRKLIFNKTPDLQKLIHLGETRLADLINQHDYTTMTLKFNTDLLNRFSISVDSFLQICLQITNYTLYGKMANTLEPITTRKFKDSRTELIPVQNDEISQLVKLFITNSTNSKKWELFEKCCKIHNKQYLDAMNGKGFERHLTSLLHLIKRPKTMEYLNYLNRGTGIDPLPSFDDIQNAYIPILSNPILNRILSPELLISNCGNPALYLFGIPPAIDQGFGMGYIIHKDKVLITICSKFRQNQRFFDTFTKITNEIKMILVNQSNFLINLNQDNDYRKYELNKLRIEKELKNVDVQSPSTKHPIELAIDQFTIPLQGMLLEDIQKKSERDFVSGTVSNPESNTSSRSSSEFDYLGGYGYFDFGELDSRNSQLHNTESLLNSPRSVSRTQSSTNLFTSAKDLDIKEKQTLNEKIREKLGTDEDVSSPSPREPKPKGQIGRSLNME